MQKKQKGIVWFKNDLRVNDNKALQMAIAENEAVIALYCFEPMHYKRTEYGFKKTERFRAQFTIESVKELQQNLDLIGITLLVYQESPSNVIPKLINSSETTTIYFQNEWTTEEDKEIKTLKNKCGFNVSFQSYYQQFLFFPESIPFSIATIPKVFTQFRVACEKKAVVQKVVTVQSMAASNRIENSTSIPTLEDLGFSLFEKDRRTAFPFFGGENQAILRLNEYLWETQKINCYKETRNGLFGIDYSTKFSPWLANGCLSPRTIYWEIKRYEKEIEANESTYWLIFELIWRDYFKYISMQHGSSIFKIDGIQKKEYNCYNDKITVNKWINGCTEEPFVNANMLELQQTGWMSNRGRQNVASYFAKNLHQDWRVGAAYFESMLLDYDVHSNYGNWMYVAGVGNDPRDRKFNIELQAQTYDRETKFQQCWLQPNLL